MVRKNTQQAFEAWIRGRSYFSKKTKNGHRAISTCGGIIYSYNTPIGKWGDVDETAILNMQVYSYTTSRQQQEICKLLKKSNIKYVLCQTLEDYKERER